MATTNITPIYNFAGMEDYALYGVGKEAQEKRAAGEDRVLYRINNCDGIDLGDYAHDVLVKNNRKREGYQVRVSFSKDDIDPDDPNSPEIAGGLMYDIMCELYPNSLFAIYVQADGEGGCMHGHCFVVNHDEVTGLALTNTSPAQVFPAADRVCARNGYSVLGQGVSRTWEKTVQNGKLNDFEQTLGNNVDFCLTHAKDMNEFKQLLEQHGVELRETEKNGKTGWSYSMVDETNPDDIRRRRRKASNLCHDFTRDEVQRYFDDMSKSRSELLKGRDVSKYVKLDAEREALLNEPEDDGQTLSDEEEPLVVDSYQTREDMCAVAEQAVRRDNNNLYEQMRERIRTDGVEQFRRDMQRMQEETERAQDVFHKAQSKADRKSGSNTAVVGRAAQQMLRTSVKQQNAGATIVALLLLMWAERERQMQRMRELMQRETVYDKRAVMWTAEKRQHAAETVLKQYEQDVRKGRVYEVKEIEPVHEQEREQEQVAQTTHDVKSDEREQTVVTEKSAEQHRLDFSRAAEPEREQAVSEPEPIEREYVEEPRLKVGGGYSTDRSMY